MGHKRLTVTTAGCDLTHTRPAQCRGNVYFQELRGFEGTERNARLSL